MLNLRHSPGTEGQGSEPPRSACPRAGRCAFLLLLLLPETSPWTKAISNRQPCPPRPSLSLYSPLRDEKRATSLWMLILLARHLPRVLPGGAQALSPPGPHSCGQQQPGSAPLLRRCSAFSASAPAGGND